MTEQEKKDVIKMRENGASFTSIATELNLPVGTVKTVCSRNKRPDAENTDAAEPEIVKESGTETDTCLLCGKPFRPTTRGRKKQFCSRICYTRWWQINRAKRTEYHRVCPTCGKAFTVQSNKRQKYCSMKCYQVSRRAGGERE